MRRTLLLGAGASVPFHGPALTTERITEWLFNPELWKRLIRRHRRLRGDANQIRFAELQADLAQFRNRYSEKNFEELVEYLDRKAEWALDPIDGSSLLGDLLRLLGTPQYHGSTVWLDVPFLARQLIAERIVEHDRTQKSSSYLGLIERQKRFLRWMSQDSDRLTIVSLNYDEILPRSLEGLGVETGFFDGGFDMEKFSCASHVVMFPHGHSRFVPTEKGVAFRCSGREANAERMKGLARIDDRETRTVDRDSSRKSYGFNSFLVTGLKKDDAFNRNPFAAYYQRMASDVLQSDEVVIIGYSLGDPHLNRFLANFLDLRSENRVLVVGKVPLPLNVYGSFLDQGSDVFRLIAGLYRKPLPLRGRIGRYRYRHNRKAAQINTKGYGFLYPQIYLYARGFGRFLGEYRKVFGSMA